MPKMNEMVINAAKIAMKSTKTERNSDEVDKKMNEIVINTA